MLMQPQQAKRFQLLVDSLTTYVNDALSICDDLVDPETGHPRTARQMEIFDALWKKPILLDEFVSENPHDLPTELLDEAKAWKMGIKGTFYIYKDAPIGTMFSHMDQVFAVRGITAEIPSLLSTKLPVAVDTILLPFEGIITYIGGMYERTEEIGITLVQSIADIVSKNDKDNLSITADQFAFASRAAKDTSAIKEASMRDAQRAIDKTGGPTTSKSSLLGLSEEDRKKAIDAYYDDFYAKMTPEYKNLAHKAQTQALDTKPFATAREGLEYLLHECTSIDEIRDAVLENKLGVEGSFIVNSRPSPEDTPQSILAELYGLYEDGPELEDQILEDLTYATENEFRTVRQVALAGGSLPFTLTEQGFEKLDAFQPLVPYVSIHCRPPGFGQTEDTYSLEMPAQLLQALQGTDWAALDRVRKIQQLVVDVCKVITDMCGIVSKQDAFKQFGEWYPREAAKIKSPEMLADIVFLMARGDHTDLGLWEHDGIEYIIADTLAADLYSSESLGSFDTVSQNSNNVEEYMASLVSCHDMLGRQSLPLELADMSLDDWYYKIPQVVALRDWLENHVPEGANELFFAEGVIDILIDYNRQSYSEVLLMETVNQQYKPSLTTQQSTEVGSLVMAMADALPCWENNGISPMQLIDVEKRQKARSQKVGRNDPCPCGSGKKYKKCCGKNA